MERVPVWKGVWESEPIIILGQNRVLYEKKMLPIPRCLRGDAVVPLPKTEHKATAGIRAQAPFLVLQEHQHLPGLLQSSREDLSSGACTWCCWHFSAFSLFWDHLPSLPLKPLAALYTSKRSQTTKSCWQQLSLSGMRQRAPSHLLTPNKCSFPVIPRTMWGCRATLAGLAPPKLPE